MKKFVFKSLIILIPLLAAFIAVNCYQFFKYKTASEVYEAIELCSKTSSYEGLVLGDSVAHQIFNSSTQNYSDRYLFATSNNAVTVFGNYLLLIKFYQNNPQLKEVKLFLRPQGFGSDINPALFYQYVIQPFYGNDYLQETVSEIKNRIEEIFTEKKVNSPFYRKLYYYLPVLRQKFLTERSATIKNEPSDLSKINEIYFKKIISFCKDHDISFEIKPSPLSNIYSKDDFLELEKKLTSSFEASYFENYLDSILYFDKSEFIDEIHFTGEALNKYLEIFMREIL